MLETPYASKLLPHLIIVIMFFYARLFPYHMYKESVSAEKELKKSRETGGGAVFGTFQTESEVSDRLST